MGGRVGVRVLFFSLPLVPRFISETRLDPTLAPKRVQRQQRHLTTFRRRHVVWWLSPNLVHHSLNLVPRAVCFQHHGMLWDLWCHPPLSCEGNYPLPNLQRVGNVPPGDDE